MSIEKSIGALAADAVPAVLCLPAEQYSHVLEILMGKGDFCAPNAFMQASFYARNPESKSKEKRTLPEDFSQSIKDYCEIISNFAVLCLINQYT